jgi:hypothetical protein
MLNPRIAVTGGRDYEDRAYVWRRLNEFEAEYGQIAEMAEGEARGVDTFCREWAIAAGVPFKPYKADWDRYGDAAGSIRNIEMLEDFKPDYLLVFPGGVGTTHCSRQARKHNIERVFYNQSDDLFADAVAWG